MVPSRKRKCNPRSEQLSSFIHSLPSYRCPVVGRMPQHASSTLACPLRYRVPPVFCSDRLSATVFPCRLSCHNNGLRVVTRDVRRSSSRRLMCAAQDHLIFLTLLINITSMTCDLSLTQMLVSLSFYLMLSILLSMLVCAASLFHGCWASRPLSILL